MTTVRSQKGAGARTGHGLLLRSQLRNLLWRRWATFSALAIVVLGVASIVAVHMIAVSVDRSLASLTAPWLGDNVLVLRKPAATAQDYAALRSWWRRGQLGDDIVSMTPVLEGSLESAGGSVRVLGVDPFSWRLPGLFEASSAGADAQRDAHEGEADNSVADDPPGVGSLAGGGVFAAAALARQPLLLQTALGDVRVHARPLAGLPAGWVAVDIGQAELWLTSGSSPAGLSYVLVAQQQGQGSGLALAERLLPGVTAAVAREEPTLSGLPDGWTVARAGSDNTLRAFAGSIMFNLAALGSLSAVVAGFLLYQAAVVGFQRESLLRERLQVLGVERWKLRGLFLLQTAIDGIAGGAVGLLGGVALARFALSLTSPDNAVELPVDWVVLAKAFATAFVVSGAARLLASRRQSTWVLPGLAAVSAVALLPGLALQSWGLLGAFGGLLACCLVAVLTVGPGFALAARLRVGGLPTVVQLGYNQLVAGRREMAAALSALALAIATAISISVMVDSFRIDLLRVLDQRLVDPVYIALDAPETAAGPAASVPVSSEVAQVLNARIAMLDPEAVVTATGKAAARIDGGLVALVYGHFDAEHTARYGFHSALAEDEVLASEQLVRSLAVKIGDSVTVATHNSSISLEVVGMFPGFGDVQPTLLLPMQAAQRLSIEPRWTRFAVDSQRADLLLRELGSDPRWQVRDAAGVRASAEEQFDRTFAITRALTVLALVVAGLGMVSAMVALRLAQTRQLALFRVLGISRRELWLMEVVRGLVLGGFACALALPLGLLMAWILCGVVNPRAFGWTVSFQPAPDMVLPALAIGMGAALAATLLSGWRVDRGGGTDAGAVVTGAGARGSDPRGIAS